MLSSQPPRIMSGLRTIGVLAMFTFVATLALTPGCAEEQVAQCLETICTAGEASCAGNSTAICNDDGKGIRYSDCGSGNYCLNGACTGRKCVNLGGGKCDTTTTLTLCDGNGVVQSTVSCAASEVCAGGSCVPNTCAEGATRCGDAYAVLTCTGGVWVDEACSGGQLCGDSGGQSACVAATCAPNMGRCDGNTSCLCSNTGGSETATKCGSNEICDGGFCRLKVCGEDATPTTDTVVDMTADAGTDAPLDIVEDKFKPPLEPPRVLKFTLGASAKVFNLNVRADYIATDKALKIQGAKGLEKIEITLSPIEPSILGLFDDTDGSETTVQICYFDGLNEGPVAPCLVGYSQASIGYTLDLTGNNGVGSRVVGTFSAVLKDALDNNVSISDGEFDVPHF